jgi:F0F1-type ATP synthase epsilon subunit
MAVRQDASTGEVVGEPTAVIDKNHIQVKVYSPFRVYFNDIARSISGINDTGPFDVLPGHHNFLSLLSPCELLIKQDEVDQRIRISRGIMHVKKDKVSVFLDV